MGVFIFKLKSIYETYAPNSISLISHEPNQFANIDTTPGIHRPNMQFSNSNHVHLSKVQAGSLYKSYLRSLYIYLNLETSCFESHKEKKTERSMNETKLNTFSSSLWQKKVNYNLRYCQLASAHIYRSWLILKSTVKQKKKM
jgi:hypothetical protein